MHHRNSKLASQIIRSLQNVPKPQRSVAISALETQYKSMEHKNEEPLMPLEILPKSPSRVKHAKSSIYEFDPEIMTLIEEESMRQKRSIDLIASSNIPIPDMNEITGVLSNKSSPGYPGKRCFNGDSVMDKIEEMGYERALKAFNLYHEDWMVNVQSLSGSIANLGTYYALMKPGETLLSLESSVGGGHHTHGLNNAANEGTNLYSQVWKTEHYHLNSEDLIDYEDVRQRALECKPKVILAGAASYPRQIDFKKFREICDEVGAILWADVAHQFGLMIAGANESPFPYADVVTASASKSMRGPRVGVIYAKKKYENAVNQAIFPGILGAPQNGNIGSMAIAFKYGSTPAYSEYAHRVVENGKALADELTKLGNNIVTGGTDGNIMIWDIKNHNINAATMVDLGEACNMQFNGVSIKSDKEQGIEGQGALRFGTNVISARDYTPEDGREVARYLNELAEIGSKIQNSEAAVWTEAIRIQELADEMEKFAMQFPLPGVSTKNIF